MKYALLIDITGIQNFIFASNKLKENLGASHLISNLFKDTVSKITVQPLKKNSGYKGYIGGGNALYFFDSEDRANKFLEEWTRYILVYAPGITIASVIDQFDENDFKNSRNTLFKKLAVNKSKYIPHTVIPRHGFSAECQSDGYSLDVWNESEKDYLSAATNAKIEAYKIARYNIERDYKDLLGTQYCFTGELDKLGQSRGSENHIAIVHIDGNSMGDRFKELATMKATQVLSKDLENAVKESFKKLIELIKSELNDPKKKDFLNIKKDNGQDVLPIRPIILGGDDITFVCDGRMGIYYAKVFMEEFAKQPASDGKPLSSCAGIAIIKTNYPFYKGYQLAEELCSNAKSRRREIKDDGSWIDFHIAYGGFSGSLREIRETHYMSEMRNLLFRPYKITDLSSEYSFESLLTTTKLLNTNWPNNKIKELREVLTYSEAGIQIFINEIEARGLKLPDVNSKGYNKTLYIGSNTPYFDMIELIEYYPRYELEDEK